MIEKNTSEEYGWRKAGPVLLREDERIDDLERNGYGIIQRKGAFCFGMDAVLLSGFAAVKPGEQALDLGTGNGYYPHSSGGEDAGKAFYRAGNSGGVCGYGPQERPVQSSGGKD